MTENTTTTESYLFVDDSGSIADWIFIPTAGAEGSWYPFEISGGSGSASPGYEGALERSYPSAFKGFESWTDIAERFGIKDVSDL